MKRQGCGFHLSQAVYRKVQDLGLVPAYLEKAGTYWLIRRLLSLHLLHHQDILPQFRKLEEQVLVMSIAASEYIELLSLCIVVIYLVVFCALFR